MWPRASPPEKDPEVQMSEIQEKRREQHKSSFIQRARIRDQVMPSGPGAEEQGWRRIMASISAIEGAEKT